MRLYWPPWHGRRDSSQDRQISLPGQGLPSVVGATNPVTAWPPIHMIAPHIERRERFFVRRDDVRAFRLRRSARRATRHDLAQCSHRLPFIGEGLFGAVPRSGEHGLPRCGDHRYERCVSALPISTRRLDRLRLSPAPITLQHVIAPTRSRRTHPSCPARDTRDLSHRQDAPRPLLRASTRSADVPDPRTISSATGASWWKDRALTQPVKTCESALQSAHVSAHGCSKTTAKLLI